VTRGVSESDGTITECLFKLIYGGHEIDLRRHQPADTFIEDMSAEMFNAKQLLTWPDIHSRPCQKCDGTLLDQNRIDRALIAERAEETKC
jgi:hypothetical protein